MKLFIYNLHASSLSLCILKICKNINIIKASLIKQINSKISVLLSKKQIQSNFMKNLIVIILLACQIISKRLWFRRVLQCETNNTVRCTKWKQSSSLMYSQYYTYFCFSENTYVNTLNGPKSMRQLTLQDQIFGLDPKTGIPRYSKLKAWLHRDVQGIVQYDEINTQNNISFQASDFHNVAFVNKQGKIEFKFAANLEENDQLVGFPQSNPVISVVNKSQPKRGLYSPFTQSGNFFIFDTAFNYSNYQPNSPMILVHSLSQVIDPYGGFWKAESIINLWDFFGWNYQPSDSQIYIHPLYQQFTFLFGSNWVPVHQQVKYYLLNHGPNLQQKQAHEQRKPSFSSRSYSHPTPTYSSYHPTYSSYPSYSYSSSYPSSSSRWGNSAASGFLFGAGTGQLASSGYSYSSSHTRQREEQDKLSAMTLSLSILQEVILL